MDNPNVKATVSLKRHSSLPASLHSGRHRNSHCKITTRQSSNSCSTSNIGTKPSSAINAATPIQTSATNLSTTVKSIAAATPATSPRSSSAFNNKHNPYVGWFRHAPLSHQQHYHRNNTNIANITSSTTATSNVTTTNTTAAITVQFDAQKQHFKTSPYIGWFRHAPSLQQCLLLQQQYYYLYHYQQPLKQLHAVQEWWQDYFCKSFSKKKKNSLSIADLPELLSTRLRGGASDGSSSNSNSNDTYSHSLSSAIFSKLACWLFAPPKSHLYPRDNTKTNAISSITRTAGLLEDVTELQSVNSDDSDIDDFSCCSSKNNQVESRDDKENNKDGYCNDNNKDNNNNHENSMSMHTTRTTTSTTVNSSSVPSHVSTSITTTTPTPPTTTLLPPSDLFVSSQAEAYYSYLTQKVASDYTDAGEHRLDVVITQMDILRMTRNASRHLDVESIWKLPTVTYNPPSNNNNNNDGDKNDKVLLSNKNKTPVTKQHDKKVTNRNTTKPMLSSIHEDNTWSFVVVNGNTNKPEEVVDEVSSLTTINNDKEKSTNANETQLQLNNQGNNHVNDTLDREVCVICLEHYQPGESLRVLPCSHSFHVGCIDCWLSGSQSFDECYTAGCPTCKCTVASSQHHHQQHGHKDDVPSWAFTQVGKSLL